MGGLGTSLAVHRVGDGGGRWLDSVDRWRRAGPRAQLGQRGRQPDTQPCTMHVTMCMGGRRRSGRRSKASNVSPGEKRQHMERVRSEGEAHIRPELQGRARRARRAGGGGKPGWVGSPSRSRAGNQAQVERRVLISVRRLPKNSSRWVLWPRREKEMCSSPGPKE
jgi:hypothetical protein